MYNTTGKKYRSWKRAQRRGHLSVDINRDANNVIHVNLVRNEKRFGKPNPNDIYMVIDRIAGDTKNATTSK